MNIETLISELWALRESKRELSQQEKLLNERYNTLKQELIQQLDEQGVNGAKTSRARVIITESQVVQTQDWDAFCAYVRENDAFHLIQKKPSVTACKELSAIEGMPPPGISLRTLRDISLTTVRGSA